MHSRGLSDTTPARAVGRSAQSEPILVDIRADATPTPSRLGRVCSVSDNLHYVKVAERRSPSVTKKAVADLLKRTHVKNGKTATVVVRPPRTSLSSHNSSEGSDEDGESFVRVRTVLHQHTQKTKDTRGKDAWIFSDAATIIFGWLIIVHVLFVGFETYFAPRETSLANPQCLAWWFVESFFLVCFTIETVLRIRAQRCDFFKFPTEVCDLFIVLMGVVDTCIMTPISLLGDDLGSVGWVNIFRVVRLARLLRILRLLRNMDQVWMLMSAMSASSKGLISLACMVMAMIYVFGIAATLLLGHAHPDSEELQRSWGTIHDSMYSLFTCMSGEAWYDIANEAYEVEPWSRVFFVCYVSLSNLIIVNLFVGIMVDKVNQVTQAEEAQRKQKADERTLEKLAHIFVMMDENGDEVVDEQELRSSPACPNVRYQFSVCGIELSKDVESLIRFWDIDDSGTLSFSEFVNGALTLKNNVISNQMIRMHLDLLSMVETNQELLLKLCSHHGFLPGGEPSGSPKANRRTRRLSRRSFSPAAPPSTNIHPERSDGDAPADISMINANAAEERASPASRGSEAPNTAALAEGAPAGRSENAAAVDWRKILQEQNETLAKTVRAEVALEMAKLKPELGQWSAADESAMQSSMAAEVGEEASAARSTASPPRATTAPAPKRHRRRQGHPRFEADAGLDADGGTRDVGSTSANEPPLVRRSSPGRLPQTEADRRRRLPTLFLGAAPLDQGKHNPERSGSVGSNVASPRQS